VKGSDLLVFALENEGVERVFGVPGEENLDLVEKAFEFAFFGACIRLRGATGAPMRPVAMPLRR
jgi:TPP-dependent 2-oxoacid decarboxylase